MKTGGVGVGLAHNKQPVEGNEFHVWRWRERCGIIPRHNMGINNQHVHH